MRARDILPEKWSEKYKRSINCSNPKGFSQRAHCQGRKKDEDQHPNEKPRGPEVKPTMPAGTVRVDVSDVYDWYKLGQHISNMKGLGKHDFGKGPPSTILSFGSEDEEHEFIQALQQISLDITDIDPAYHDKRKGIKTDPTYNVNESDNDHTTVDLLITHFREFLELCMKELDLEKLPKIRWIASGDLHKQKHTFGLFKNKDQVLEVEITGRHPIDIMRTLAHELVHYRQFLDGRLTKHSGKTGSAIENETHAITGVIMRKFDDRHPDAFQLKPITESLEETRQGAFNWLKSYLPNWPDYVLRDWIYRALTKHDPNENPKEVVDRILAGEGMSAQTQWKLIPNFEFNLDKLHPDTQRRIKIRAGGSANPMNVPKDAERHATQAALAQKQGGVRKEPVIGKMTSQGFELIEGWHRTIQHFNQFPKGYRGPAWVATNATAESLDENFADGKVKGKSRPGRVKKSGASCKGSVSELRARAKKYGGERGKMYHWCANMKGGKK